jgi:integrase/recombinase XerD
MDSTAQKANLKQYRKIDGRWQFVPVVKTNGKPDPRLVLIDGQPTSSKGGGKFYVEFREAGKRMQRPCGSSPREALDAWQQQMGILSGAIEAPVIEPRDSSTTIDAAVKNFLAGVKATKSAATHEKYERNLGWFRERCKKNLVSQLTDADIIHLFGIGRDEGANQKTINGRIVTVLSAMREAGSKIKVKKRAWPKTIDKAVEIYEPDQIKRFFAACNDRERLIFQTFLLTGFRSRELSTLGPEDILPTYEVRVQAKDGFTPKSYEKRQITIPESLYKMLNVQVEKSTTRFLFPSLAHPTRPGYGGGEDSHLLETCKEIAFKAGLNCGKCKGTYTVKRSSTRKEVMSYSCKTSPRCDKWYLHKWRDTYATNMLRDGVDIKTLQVLLGHKDLATTDKYLKALTRDGLRAKVEASSLAAYL